MIKCKYDNTFTCIQEKGCTSSSLVDCLKIQVGILNHRQMKRHNDTSIKWRNRSFYYKKKCIKLETLVKKGGVK